MGLRDFWRGLCFLHLREKAEPPNEIDERSVVREIEFKMPGTSIHELAIEEIERLSRTGPAATNTAGTSGERL